MKYLLLTDIPAPWREKVYELVYKALGDEFHVVYSAHNEKRRLWSFAFGKHPKTFLKCLNISIKGHERFCCPGIVPFILKHRPNTIVCFSFVPTIFLAFLVAKLMRIRVVVFADTWLGRDIKATIAQKLAKKFVFTFVADSFIGASKQTLRMYKHYNRKVRNDRLFLSPLCADNDYFLEYLKGKRIEKQYDLMFSGRIVETKNPFFFADVAAKVKHRRGHCKVLVIGDGNEDVKKRLFHSLEKNGITCHFAGFIEHTRLPEYYSQAKLLLLPTSGDCWGVVINEANICRVPVITTHLTAAAGELVLHERNGYVLKLDSDLWASKICSLLDNPQKLKAFSNNAYRTVTKFHFQTAANGIVNAFKYWNIPK